MVLLDLRQAHWGPSPKRPYPLAAGFRSNLGLVPPLASRGLAESKPAGG